MRLIEEGVVIEDGKEIAKIIGNHYDDKIKKIKNRIEATECNEDPLKHMKNWGKDNNAEFSLPDFTNKDVIKAIENMKITQATGRTGLSKKLLHLARNVIAQHLANIFNKSIADKKYPEEFKRLKALPLHKKGAKTAKENHRLICNMDTAASVFESLLGMELMNFMNTNNLLPNVVIVQPS